MSDRNPTPAQRLSRGIAGRLPVTSQKVPELGATAGDALDFQPLDPATLEQLPAGAAVNAGYPPSGAVPGQPALWPMLDERPDTQTLKRLTLAYDRRRGLTTTLVSPSTTVDEAVDAAVDRLADVVDANPHLASLTTTRIPRQVVRRVIVLPVVALLAGLGLVTGTPRAEAAVIPLSSRPIVLTVSGPTARLDVDMVSTAPTTRDGGHIVTLVDGPLTTLGVAGTGFGGGPALVHLGATVPSRELTPGTTMATLTDIGDGLTAQVPVTVLRQSRVTATVQMVQGGRMLIVGAVSHFDLSTGTYRGDLASPVLVQVLEHGTWVTAATVTTTGPTGAVAQVLTAPQAGTWQVRLVRPMGATVSGATSPVRAVTSAG